MAETLSGLGARLVEGGVPVSRISMGLSMLHPTIGFTDMQLSSDTGRVQLQDIARSAITKEMLSNNPFGDLASGKYDRIRADLRNPDEVARYAIFQQFADSGVTDYLAFKRHFGQRQSHFVANKKWARGAMLSFSTKRFSGFSPEQLEGLERLVPAVCVCSRVYSDRRLACDVLEAYLGRISGQKVLAGQVVLGDGEQIDCAIFYSDLRASLALPQTLDIQT